MFYNQSINYVGISSAISIVIIYFVVVCTVVAIVKATFKE